MYKQYMSYIINLFVQLGDYSETTRIVAMICLTGIVCLDIILGHKKNRWLVSGQPLVVILIYAKSLVAASGFFYYLRLYLNTLRYFCQHFLNDIVFLSGNFNVCQSIKI